MPLKVEFKVFNTTTPHLRQNNIAVKPHFHLTIKNYTVICAFFSVFINIKFCSFYNSSPPILCRKRRGGKIYCTILCYFSSPRILVYIIKPTRQRQIHWHTHHQTHRQNRKYPRYTLWDEQQSNQLWIT